MVEPVYDLLFEHLRRMSGQLSELRELMLEMRGDIAELRSSVADLSLRVAHVETGLARLSSRVDRMDERLYRVETRLGLVEGAPMSRVLIEPGRRRVDVHDRYVIGAQTHDPGGGLGGDLLVLDDVVLGHDPVRARAGFGGETTRSRRILNEKWRNPVVMANRPAAAVPSVPG